MELDVIHAANLKPGDLWAGTVEPAAPTRPVNNFARAMRLTDVEIVTGEDGRKIVQCQAHGLALTPVSIGTQCLVIRPDGEQDAPADFPWMVRRRTFKARNYPKGSAERARLNQDARTSEHEPSLRYMVTDGRVWSAHRTEREASAEAYAANVECGALDASED